MDGWLFRRLHGRFGGWKVTPSAGWSFRRLKEDFAGWLLVFRCLDGFFALVGRSNGCDPDPADKIIYLYWQTIKCWYKI